MDAVNKQEIMVRETIRTMLMNVVTQHEKFGANLQHCLLECVYDLLRSGAGVERVLDVAASVSAHLYAEVAGAINEILYGPQRRFQSPVYQEEGVDLEDPELVIAYTDAECHSDLNQYTCVVVILSSEGRELARRRRELNHVTSDEAEYHGVILALETALELGFNRVEVRSNSALMICQLNAECALHLEILTQLYERVRELLRLFRYVKFTCVSEEQNEDEHR